MNKWDKPIGVCVTEIWMDEDRLVLLGLRDGEEVAFNYYVDAECCSESYFHDFIGVDKLLSGNPIVAMNEVDGSEVSEEEDAAAGKWYEVIQTYGYEFVIDHAEFGEVTAVVSFRNRSNGYYGGDMLGGQVFDKFREELRLGELRQITEDVIEL